MTARPAAETVGFEPHLFVLFGATGDLARRMLVPAIYRLLEARDFADRMHLLGAATSELDDAEFREIVAAALVEAGWTESDAERWCADCVSYVSLKGGFDAFAEKVAEIETSRSLPGNRAFYLAIPPSVFDDTVEGLARVGLTASEGWTRVVVEKPFGTDLESARHLNAVLHRHFTEDQIFRIDHYLAKETVQNLLAFRFANMLFESGWNRNQIDSVEITVAETLGLEGRAKYFDQAGVIRDIVQNHLLQVLTLVAMEPPVRLEADSIRDEKVKVLRSIYPVSPEAVRRGRYTAGRIDGVDVPGYLDEDGVPATSVTETYASIRIDVDNWRWRGVPFTLRTGKRLAERLTQIAVRYKEPPVSLFEVDGACRMHANVLFITLQPNEGFHLTFDVKRPGEGMELVTQDLEFHYADAFGRLPDAYETLIADLLVGDQTLFVRGDETEEAWRILAPALDIDTDPESYAAGSWGPEGAFERPPPP
ncbi:MAG TPA: glucose-6-phosphate dehydrogenase [Acidimicrobiia bacterium]|nr:glucose-6-phosphate dehydrogenase [Acidimicrobiia bacterium]